jgi:CheY-like chemotaxis protein
MTEPSAYERDSLERQSEAGKGGLASNRRSLGVRILVVDDDADTTKGFCQLLAALGYSSQGVTDANLALQAARDFQPHVVALDLAMPGQDGFAIMRQIRSDPAIRHTIIVVTSGYCRDTDRARAFEAGADHFLAKPLSLEKLREIAMVASERANPPLAG